MKTWSYNLSVRVKLAASGEQGEIIGRAEYVNRPDLYMIRYVAGDGRQVEAWFDEDAFTLAF